MTADQPVTIFGRAITGRAILASGVLITVAVGSLGMMAPWLSVIFIWCCGGLILFRLAVGLARILWRRQLPSPSEMLMAVAMLRLANMVAILLLGLATLAAFAAGYSYWDNLLRAFVIDLMIGTILYLAMGIGGNSAAFWPNRRPPLTPPV